MPHIGYGAVFGYEGDGTEGAPITNTAENAPMRHVFIAGLYVAQQALLSSQEPDGAVHEIPVWLNHERITFRAVYVFEAWAQTLIHVSVAPNESLAHDDGVGFWNDIYDAADFVAAFAAAIKPHTVHMVKGEFVESD